MVWVWVLQSGLAGPLDPILAALVGFNTFEEANEGITSIYKAWALKFTCASAEWQWPLRWPSCCFCLCCSLAHMYFTHISTYQPKNMPSSLSNLLKSIVRSCEWIDIDRFMNHCLWVGWRVGGRDCNCNHVNPFVANAAHPYCMLVE